MLILVSPTKARDFEGAGGPETKQQMYEEANPGNDDVKSNVRQQKKPLGDTVPTSFGPGPNEREVPDRI